MVQVVACTGEKTFLLTFHIMTPPLKKKKKKRWDGMAWNKLPGQASCITVDDQGGVWAATSQGRIYFLASKSFVWRPVEGSASVIAAAGRHVVSLTKDGTSQLWNGMCWDPLGQERLQHIAVNSQGAIWGVDIHGGIRKLELGRSPVPKTLESCCKVALRSAHGKFLCAETNGHVVSNRDAAGPWYAFSPPPPYLLSHFEFRETWFFQPTATNEGSFRSHHGKYLCAERNHSVVANRERADIW